MDAVTSITWGDFSYLYKGKESFSIGFLEILNHYFFAWTFLIFEPVMSPIMFIWLIISSFQLLVIFIYVEVIKGEPTTEEIDEIDIYY